MHLVYVYEHGNVKPTYPKQGSRHQFGILYSKLSIDWLSLMLFIPPTPVAEAAVFTLGLILIRAQRHRAEQLTNALTVLAVVCLLSIAFLALSGEQMNTVAEAAAAAEMGAFVPQD
jgi:hypothetical protein